MLKTGLCVLRSSVGRNISEGGRRNPLGRPLSRAMHPPRLLLQLLILTVIFVATGSNAPWQNPPTSVSGVIRPATGEGSAQGSRTSQPHLSSNPSSDDGAINDKYFDHFDLTHEFSSEILCTRSYEFKNSSDNVKGSLRAHLPFWKGIKANSFVIDIIENVYSIPFISRPPRK